MIASVFAKVLPLAILAGGVYKGQDKIRAIANFPVKMGVQMEMTNIARILTIETVDESWPMPEEFSEYLRASMKKKKGRDVASDLWGSRYVLCDKEERLIVVSAGPDCTYNTPDDLKSTVHKY